MKKIILALTVACMLLSCGNYDLKTHKEQEGVTIADIVSGRAEDAAGDYGKFSPGADFKEDSSRAVNSLQLLFEEKLIDRKTRIYSESVINFCALSPSVMLRRFSTAAHTPDSIHFLLPGDIEYMMEQYYRHRQYKTWKKILQEKLLDTTGTAYPYYALSLPVYARKPGLFVMAVELHKASSQVDGKSWLVIFNGNKIEKKILFDQYSSQ